MNAMNRQKRKVCQTSLFSIILVIFILRLTQAQAETAQEMTELAHHHILTNLDHNLRDPVISLAPLSVTAKTPTCQHPIAVRWNGGKKTGNINLTLICTQPKWQRYVSAKISGKLPVVVTNHDLARETKISKEDVHIDWLPDTQVKYNALTRIEDIVNLSTRQFISAGNILTSNQVSASTLIHKGDSVRILAIGAGINIEMTGTALDSGEKDKQIRVQNHNSGKIIKGKVYAADTVIVP
jgi:flagella basal body P-ring formation protein FlgA